MRIGILGSGLVAQTLATKLASLGHDVMISSRNIDKAKETAMGKVPAPSAWAEEHGGKAGSFADAAAHGEAVINATAGAASLEVLATCNADDLAGKVLVDVANALDFSKGMPPSLTVCNTDSLAEQIQRAYPDAKVVKALNTVNAHVMVEPSLVSGDHDLFICGNDAEAKQWVTDTLLKEWFGWKSVLDLGGVENARGTEMLVIPWVMVMGHLGTPVFNWHVAR